ncbi:MAG: penicillin-binding protein 2 [bacterium]
MKNYGIKKTLKDIEPHEVFLDKLAKAKEEELGITEKKFEVPLKEGISYALFGIFLVLTIVLFSKTFFLQAIEGKKLSTAAENNKGSASLILPERGIIYDKNFKKLVSNSPAFDLICERAIFSFPPYRISGEIESIAGAIGADAFELSAKIKGVDSSDVLVAEDLSHEALLVLEARISDLKGCRIRQNTARNYLYGQVFSQILGYTGRINPDEYSSSIGYAINDYIGKTGLEKYYEEYLRGVPGKTKQIRNASGGQESQQIMSDPVPGNNLVLNIDADLQEEVYKALEKSIKNVGAKKGAAVAMNPKTGAVLALVSYPSYDNNLFSRGISLEDFNKIQSDPNQPLFNRVIQAQYPTGSTIKPFEASGALQENIISPTKLINDPGYIEVRNQYDPSIVYRYRGVTPHGWVDMREAIAVSSNIYFYTIGGGYGDQQGLGPARIKKYLELFGWGNITGIDLPGEFAGFIPTPDWKKQNIKESWWDGDTYNLSIGQSYLKVTPLQVASAYAAIANGGTLYRPQIVNQIINPSASPDGPLIILEPEIIRKDFIDSENLQIVREGMRDCVNKAYGSCLMLNNLPVDVAGKTGTAETGRDGIYNAWASAYAPYDNPEIVFVATIEGVNGLQSATLPVARDVLEWYFSEK